MWPCRGQGLQEEAAGQWSVQGLWRERALAGGGSPGSWVLPGSALMWCVAVGESLAY